MGRGPQLFGPRAGWASKVFKLILARSPHSYFSGVSVPLCAPLNRKGYLCGPWVARSSKCFVDFVVSWGSGSFIGVSLRSPNPKP